MSGKITDSSGAGSVKGEMVSQEPTSFKLTSLELTRLELSSLEKNIASLEAERLWLKELSRSIDNVPDVIPYQSFNANDNVAHFTFFGSHVTRIADYTAEEALADYSKIERRISRQDMPGFIAKVMPAIVDGTPLDFTSYHSNLDGSVRRTRLHVNGDHRPGNYLLWHGYLSEVEGDDETIVEEEDSLANAINLPSADLDDPTFSDEYLAHLLAGGLFQSRDVFILTEPDGRLLFINDAFELLTGTMRAGMTRQENISEYMGDSEQKYFLDNGLFPDGEVKYRARDGKTKTVIQSATPVYENGAIVNFIIVARDISKELDFLNRLDKVKHLESMGTLASSIAHDLNNVLQAIMIYASCIEESHNTSSAINGGQSKMNGADLMVDDASLIIDNAPSMIVKSCDRAAALVTRVLSHTRQSQKEPVIFDGGSVLDECTAFLNLNNPGFVRLESEQAESSDRVSIFCDPNDFRQLIICLCSFGRTASAVSSTPGVCTSSGSKTSGVGTTSGRKVSENIRQNGRFKLNLRKRDGLPLLLAEFKSNETVKESSIDYILLKGLVDRIGCKVQLSQNEEGMVKLEIILPAPAEEDASS